MIFIIIIVILILDQAIKLIVSTNMGLFESIPIIDGIFSLTYIQNTGAAFGIFGGKTMFLIVIPLTMLLALFCFMIIKRKAESKQFMLGIALIVAGGLGNIIDRIRLGYVVDFFDFHVFPIFNIADISVCMGVGIIMIEILILEPRRIKKGLKMPEADEEMKNES